MQTSCKWESKVVASVLHPQTHYSTSEWTHLLNVYIYEYKNLLSHQKKNLQAYNLILHQEKCDEPIPSLKLYKKPDWDLKINQRVSRTLPEQEGQSVKLQLAILLLVYFALAPWLFMFYIMLWVMNEKQTFKTEKQK